MKEIKYKPINKKYLPPSLVDDCFVKGKHTFVDKTYTGNGFTHATLNSELAEGITIIIAPNQEVVKSKEASDKAGGLSNNRSYIYEKCKDNMNMLTDKVIFIVADSFLHNIKHFIKWKDKISRILIDEVHQVVIQSTFRSNLIGFRSSVDKHFPDKAIVSVTATPMLFQEVDIKFISKIKKEPTKIFVSENQENSLERAKESIRQGKKVLFATHDVRLIKRLIGDGELRANFKVGDNLMRSIIEFIPNVHRDSNSNLTIISSRGFEGFDLKGKHDVYIFEERSRDYTTFFAQNVYQIIGRSRDGVGYVEWSCLNHYKRRKMPCKEKMQKQADSKKISTEKKMTDNNYRDVSTYYIKEIDPETGLAKELIFNEDRYNLDNEMSMCDVNGIKTQYEEYFKIRDCELVFLEKEQRYQFGTAGIKPRDSVIFKNVHSNKDIVTELGLMKDITPPHYTEKTVEDYLKKYKVYMRRKFWNLKKLPFNYSIDDLPLNARTVDGSEINEMAFRNALVCKGLLNNEKAIDKEVATVLKKKKLEKQEEFGRRSKEYKEWLEKYSPNLKNRYIRLLMVLSDTEFKISEKIRNHRDYNIFTEVSMGLIESIAKNYYNFEVKELDIRTAYPRIIYAVLGKKLPEDFYGIKGTKERQQKKRNISKLMNSLSKDQALLYVDDNEKALKEKKSKLKAELKKSGFCEDTATSLMDNYWDKPKDTLHNSCSYHEKLVTEKLMRALQIRSDELGAEIRMVRRHDSIIVFGNWGREFYDVVNQFEYLDQKGWFNELKDDLIELEVQEITEVIEVVETIEHIYTPPTEDPFGNPYDADLEIEF